MKIRRSKYFLRGRYCVEFLAGVVVASAEVLASFVRWFGKAVKTIYLRSQRQTSDKAGAYSVQGERSQNKQGKEAIAQQALVKLGFSKPEAQRRIDAIDTTLISGLSVEEVVAGALRSGVITATSSTQRRSQT